LYSLLIIGFAMILLLCGRKDEAVIRFGEREREREREKEREKESLIWSD